MNEVPQSATNPLFMLVWCVYGMPVVCFAVRMFLRLNGNRITAWLCGFSYVLRKNVSKNVSIFQKRKRKHKKIAPGMGGRGLSKKEDHEIPGSVNLEMNVSPYSFRNIS